MTSSRLPFGHRIDREFVCMDCLQIGDHRPGGISSGGHSAVDERVGSGKECSRCERRMPYLAKVRILPDGYSMLPIPKSSPIAGNKAVWLEREEKVLIDGHALVYVSIGTNIEVGLQVHPSGKVEIWIYKDTMEDPEEPDARWEYDPNGDASKGGEEP